MAKVSKQPGKTRLINYFSFTEEIDFVDLPGYGYAKVSKSKIYEWTKLMEDYFKKFFEFDRKLRNEENKDVQNTDRLRQYRQQKNKYSRSTFMQFENLGSRCGACHS